MGRCELHFSSSGFSKKLFGLGGKVGEATKLIVYRYSRHNFDYAILALFLIYGFSFGMFVFARLRLRTWIMFLKIVWPCLIATDVFCFVAGWIATWRDVSLG